MAPGASVVLMISRMVMISFHIIIFSQFYYP